MKKERRERTPRGAMERITKQNGGGAHRDRKNDYRRAPKHRGKDASHNMKSCNTQAEPGSR